MNSKKVSVIIPAYNVENYIFRAIESSLNQTYKNVEIIVIDDGSIDRTWEIISKYADENINIISYRQSNSGVSSARNKGIEISTGDYFIFLDSDDWLEVNAIEKLIDIQRGYQKSLVGASLNLVFSNDNVSLKTIKANKNCENVYIQSSDICKCISEGKYNIMSSCYKLFNREIVYRNNIRFSTEIYHGEDGLFVFHYLRHVDGYYFFNNSLWNILERPDSATTSQFNSKWLTAIVAVEKMINYPNLTDNDIKELKKYLVIRTLMLKRAVLNLKETDKKSLDIINKYLKAYSKFYLFSRISCKKKLYFLIIRYFPKWFIKNYIK